MEFTLTVKQGIFDQFTFGNVAPVDDDARDRRIFH